MRGDKNAPYAALSKSILLILPSCWQIDDELPRRRDCTSAEIVMTGISDGYEAFGCLDERVEPFAEIDWDDSILFAMEDQDRSSDLGRAQVRAKLILHKKPHWHKPLVPRADIDC
jgi:hypothetical protein